MRHTRLFLIATVAAVLLFSGALGYTLVTKDEKIDSNTLAIERAETARIALCLFRADLERRADDSKRFADEIESGVRPEIPGISIADLRRSERAQRATVKSLTERQPGKGGDILGCKEMP